MIGKLFLEKNEKVALYIIKKNLGRTNRNRIVTGLIELTGLNGRELTLLLAGMKEKGYVKNVGEDSIAWTSKGKFYYNLLDSLIAALSLITAIASMVLPNIIVFVIASTLFLIIVKRMLSQ